MQALEPLLLIAFLIEAAVEVVKMLRERTLQWENVAAGFLAYPTLAVNNINIFLLIGLEGNGTDAFWVVSYVLASMLIMRFSGGVHHFYNLIKRILHARIPR
jgi:hypothetical protein